ncbi:pyridoxal phosphate-dependent transferase [Kalaharituber pfeilii]|nr:pyridoxal phosphate-dependent transferase [Kalaharituber pfeilii]
MHEELCDYMNNNLRMEHNILTYGDGPCGSLRLRTNLAEFFNTYFQPVQEVQPGEILVSSGVSGVLDQLMWGICNEGDGVLIGRPVYAGFVTDLQSRSKAVPIPVAFGNIDPFSIEALKCYKEHLDKFNEEAKGKENRVKAIILTNPHNPLGKCYSRETIKAFMRFCQKHDLHLVSDEIYALSVFTTKYSKGAVEFTSALSIDTEWLIDTNRLHILYGMSKDFSSNGLRLGCLITRNVPLYQALSSIIAFSWPSAPADLLWSTILEDKAWLSYYLTENQKRLAESYEFLTSILDKYGINYVKEGNAGFYLWCDLGFAFEGGGAVRTGEEGKRRDKNLERRILDGGLYLATTDGFLGEEWGWYRITFSYPRPLLLKGLQRLLKVVKGVHLEVDEQVLN